MLEKVKVDDIPNRYDDIIEAVGIDGFLGLVQLYGGDILYLPTVKSLAKNCRDRIIKEEFEGDYGKMARKYGLSKTQIYNIINK